MTELGLSSVCVRLHVRVYVCLRVCQFGATLLPLPTNDKAT